ncbi:dual OB domain-containing protein [Aeromonas caviae]|uniref:dual OB domain-containing protein n=1 Tax=Aeromonas caviae TaxID=648 RepID=UPI000AF53810|nr:hypothetical protein [Aeromonas caviae]
MPSMTFIILAKSVKHKKFCIAGKSYNNGNIGNWVRPVNSIDPESDALTHSNIEYYNKQHPELLHITAFNFIQKIPHPIQNENYSIDTSLYWSKIGSFNRNNINHLLDTPLSLWHNNYSSYNGKNDKFPTNLISHPIQSLYFIYVHDLKVRVKAEGADFGNNLKKYRGFFSYNGHDYGIVITDPQIYSYYGRHSEGIYNVGACYLTLSTASHNDGFCYKFIAAIIS